VVEERLGEGAMGQVYRVRHNQLAKHFALKVIAPAFASDARARERFNIEAQLASEISHPNIVSVVDFGEDETLGAFMVMELLEGEPLALAEGSSPLSVRRALDVLAQVADALDHIHKRGIVHGDVKAENLVMVAEPSASGTRRRRVVRLLDFGLARRLGGGDAEVSGTPHYMAPERCSGGEATIATDIYALGVLGYMLFTRSVPFDGTVLEIIDAHVHRVPEPLSARRGEVLDDAIETLIMRALSKQPSIRHASAAAFRYELNAVMHVLDMSPRRQSSVTTKSDRREAAAAQLFEQSLLPQAVIGCDGTIKLANKAFAMLLGEADGTLKGRPLCELPLQLWVPDLPRALRKVRAERTPIERRARRWTNELVVWLTPTGIADDVHLLVQSQSVERQVPKPER
jgi:eukaryotic-like serine/threonine-protein kinase